MCPVTSPIPARAGRILTSQIGINSLVVRGRGVTAIPSTSKGKKGFQ